MGRPDEDEPGYIINTTASSPTFALAAAPVIRRNKRRLKSAVSLVSCDSGH
jgi:hypothetical protein